MKNKVVKFTLMLSMLLIAAIPAQAFASEKNQTAECEAFIGQYSVNCGGNNDSCNLKNDNCNAKNLNCNNDGCNLNCNWFMKDGTKKYCPNLNFGQVESNWCQKDCNENNGCQNIFCPDQDKPNIDKPNKPDQDKPNKPDQDNNGSGDSSTIGTYEKQVISLVNNERTAVGLKPLSANASLGEIAELKAEDMSKNNYFSHTSPTYGSAFDMMNKFNIKYTAAGENIAKGQKTPESVMSGWMNSKGHRENILNAKYEQIGVGYTKDGKGNTYWVQMFIK